MDWTNVVTEPLGLAGFALAGVFAMVTRIIARRSDGTHWVVPAGFLLAAVCVFGGLLLAYQRVRNENNRSGKPAESTTAITPRSQDSPSNAAPSMGIGTIEQHVDKGAAVSGVQGDVTINSPASQTESKPKR